MAGNSTTTESSLRREIENRLRKVAAVLSAVLWRDTHFNQGASGDAGPGETSEGGGMSETMVQQFCRELCAFMGEPPCFEIDRDSGEDWEPCEHCLGADAVARAALASKDAEIERLRVDMQSLMASLNGEVNEIERLTEDVQLLEGVLTDVSECLFYGHGRDTVVDALKMIRDRMAARATTQAAEATPQPRSEVSGPEAPGNHSGDPE